LPVFLDLNLTKLLVLGVVALLVFGPDRLPGLAAQAGRALRELRRMAEGAKSELKENLGPEFSNFDIEDLNPKRFVRKHLAAEFTGDGVLLDRLTDGNGNGTVADNGSTVSSPAPDSGAAHGAAANGWISAMATLTPGESPPYDAEAT
jgi:sec-independent protein translocase protein TatB